MDRESRISVVMATYNRAETIRTTLDHLCNQTLDANEYEVIVIDDGSPDNTIEVLKEYETKVNFKFSWYTHQNSGPGYTQNVGIRHAISPVVLLIADDIFLQPAALKEHLKIHVEHPEENVATLGQVMQSSKVQDSVFMKTWDPFKFQDLKGIRELPYYMFWACNISVKKDFMLEHGMFREQMGRAGAAAHEDVELGCRLHKQGLRIMYAEKALGYHYHIENLAGAMKRAYQRGLNWEEFREIAAQPEITIRYHVLNSKTIGDHFKVLFGDARKNLMGADRSIVLLSLRYMLRFLLFNKLTVNVFWLPVLNAAESNHFLERLMHRNFYRGVISYHFFQGCRDADKIYPTKDPQVRSL